MTKRKKSTVVSFVDINDKGGDAPIGTFAVNRVPLKPGAKRFLHLELKNGTWVMLDAMGFGETPFIGFSRFSDFTHVTIGDRDPLWIAVHTKVSLNDHSFYHLDELANDRWRIAYSGVFSDKVDKMGGHNHLSLINFDWSL